MKQNLITVSVCSVSVFLVGCMVGPKYVKPAVATAPAFKEPPPDSFKEGDSWKPAQPGDQALRGKWWEIFGDPQLNALESVCTVSDHLHLTKRRERTILSQSALLSSGSSQQRNGQLHVALRSLL